MSKNITSQNSFTIIVDLDSLETLQDTKSPYREWLYLNRNISSPALQALYQDLNNQDDLTPDKRAHHISALFSTLEELAPREAVYEIQDAYEKYIKAVTKDPNDTLEARKIFVNYCAEKIPFNGNHIEKVAADALQKLLDEAANIEECRKALNESLERYTNACKEQCDKDFHRNHVHMNSDLSLDHIKTQDKLPNTLTGEQRGFISTMLDQGKFVGGQSVAIQRATILDPYQSDETYLDFNQPNPAIPKTLIQETDGRIYCISTFSIYRRDMCNPSDGVLTGTMQTITDITDLKGQEFRPGMASNKVNTKIIITGDKNELYKLKIPAEFQDKKLSDSERRITEQTERFLSRVIEQYLNKNLQRDTELTTKKVQELSEGISEITDSISKDQTFKDELRKESGNIVRKYAKMQESKFSTRENIQWIYAEYIKPILQFCSKKHTYQFIEKLKDEVVKSRSSQKNIALPNKADRKRQNSVRI